VKHDTLSGGTQSASALGGRRDVLSRPVHSADNHEIRRRASDDDVSRENEICVSEGNSLSPRISIRQDIDKFMEDALS